MTAPLSVATDRLDPAVWKITSVAILGVLLSQLDSTIVNVSLSNLAVDLQSSLSTIQWVASAYLLALTLVLPLSGWLVDRIGAKALYLCCFVTFTLSSALCGLAWSAPSLIACRALQGVSGGLLAPMGQMVIARVAGTQMARVVGYGAMPTLLAPILGPVIAGAILQYASWRWLFLVNLPVGALAFVLALLFLPDDQQETNRRELDWLGLAVLSPGLVLLVYGSDRFGQIAGRAAVVAAVVLLATFVWIARRKGDRALIDVRLFGGRVFSAAAIIQFLSYGVMFAGQVLTAIYLIQACGRSPRDMGWLLAPAGLGMMVAYPSMGALTKRFGVRRLSVGAASLALAGTMLLIYEASHGLDLVVLALALFLRGMGQGAIGLSSMAVAYTSVTRANLPTATTTLNIVQRLGPPILTTICATFLEWRLRSQPAGPSVLGPYALAFVLLFVLQALILVTTTRLPSRADGR